jgi:hypothetical protein
VTSKAAGTVADRVVALTKVVERSVPPKFTTVFSGQDTPQACEHTAAPRNPVPITVNGRSPEPAAVDAGLRLEIEDDELWPWAESVIRISRRLQIAKEPQSSIAERRISGRTHVCWRNFAPWAPKPIGLISPFPRA